MFNGYCNQETNEVINCLPQRLVSENGLFGNFMVTIKQ